MDNLMYHLQNDGRSATPAAARAGMSSRMLFEGPLGEALRVADLEGLPGDTPVVTSLQSLRGIDAHVAEMEHQRVYLAGELEAAEKRLAEFRRRWRRLRILANALIVLGAAGIAVFVGKEVGTWLAR